LERATKLLLATGGDLGLYDPTRPEIRIVASHNMGFDRDLSVIMLDIDHFKGINGSYGHAFGDYVLNILAQFIQGQLREVDTIGRFGGKEFTIILPETELADARWVADRICEMVRDSL
jgi:diguanylate cyclase (GGDEF)-like protein